MPIHDWSRVDAGVFHDFHQRWIVRMSDALNEGLLPSDFYALTEQVAEGPVPDVVTLERIDRDLIQPSGSYADVNSAAVVALAECPPKVKYTHAGDLDVYADRALRVAVHHVSGDRVVGYIEVVSPGNKHSEAALQNLIRKLQTTIKRGCHALVIDLHPPTSRDPRGLHSRFWSEYFGTAPGVSPEQPLGLAAYRSDLVPTAYFHPTSVGESLIDMPIFLTPDLYVNVPLEATYEMAWKSVPRRWRDVIDAQAPE